MHNPPHPLIVDARREALRLHRRGRYYMFVAFGGAALVAVYLRIAGSWVLEALDLEAVTSDSLMLAIFLVSIAGGLLGVLATAVLGNVLHGVVRRLAPESSQEP